MTDNPDIWRNKIRKLEFIPASEFVPADLTVWFEGSEEPFSIAEFKDGSATQDHLQFLETVLSRLVNL